MRPFFMAAPIICAFMTSGMPTHPALQQFIDDELARAPLLLDQVLQQLIDTPLRFDPTASSAERMALIGQHEGLVRARPHIVRAFVEKLRAEVLAVAKEQDAARRGLTLAEADELSLALVDEDEVAADVELQRAIVVIHSTAEFELRELRTFTSALVGDVNVAHDTNPFRPDAYARALLAGARALQGTLEQQLALMRRTTTPLAQALRKAYAAACTRLESQGIEPGTYRTIILPPSVQGPRTMVHAPKADLHALRDNMPVPFDDAPMVRAAPPPAPSHGLRPFGEAPPAHRVDQQLIELLTRLFDAILADKAIAADVKQLVARLQSSAVRVALRDPGMLDAYDHPVWEFLDRLAFGADRLQAEAGERQRFLRYAQGLVENMAGEPGQDAGLYRWGSQRLAAFDEHLLAEHIKASQAQIDSLRTLALAQQHDSGAAPAAGDAQPGMPLDVGQLETVPAELMDLDTPSPPSTTPPAAPAVEPGEWLSVFLQGSWRELQLLWTDARGQQWLLRQGGGRTWALHRRAVERLHAAGLAEPLEAPSLVQHAAQQVLRQIPGAARPMPPRR